MPHYDNPVSQDLARNTAAYRLSFRECEVQLKEMRTRDQNWKMIITHHDLEIELDGDWLVAAGMSGFVPASKAYRISKLLGENTSIQEIRIEDIGPVHRSVGIFRDSPDGIPVRERVINILRGFRSGDAIPPVKFVENKPGSAHRYKLTDGTHRLYCSIAVGFTHIPAVKGFDWDSLDQ